MLSPIYCNSALLGIWVRLGMYGSFWSGIFLNYTSVFSGFYFLMRTLICTVVIMLLLSVVFDMILVLELHFVNHSFVLLFLPFFKFQVRVGNIWILLEREASILYHLYPASLSQEFKPVSIYCFFYSKLSRSQLQAKSTKGKAFLPARSELKCITRRVQMWNLLCCCFS